jgi:NAD-dependent deacetylase
MRCHTEFVDDGTLREVARRLREAWKTTVLTGAGLSAASGVPTFRGADGLWRTHQAEDLASVQGFRADPQLVWEFTLERKRVIAACAPNRAHEILAAWSRTLPSFTVLTQNVDGLHDRAGTVSVIELHGSIWEVGCALQCVDSPRRWRDESLDYRTLPPTCIYCGALLRPGEVWFGEQLPLDRTLRAAQSAQRCDVMLVIGTTAVVEPAASFIEMAKSPSTLVVEINPEPSRKAAWLMDVVLAAPAVEVLERLDSELRLADRA